MDRLAERLKNLSPLQRAVLALKETQARLESLQSASRPNRLRSWAWPAVFPAGSLDPRPYWQLLCAGVDAIRETPPDRWDIDRFYDPDPTAPEKCARAGADISTRSTPSTTISSASPTARRCGSIRSSACCWNWLGKPWKTPACRRRRCGERRPAPLWASRSANTGSCSPPTPRRPTPMPRRARRSAWRPTACRSSSACKGRAWRWTRPAPPPWSPSTWPASTSATANARWPWPAART